MTHPSDDENVDLQSDEEEAGDADVDATPRATTPITPFGDAKPWAGSLVDPAPEGDDQNV